MEENNKSGENVSKLFPNKCKWSKSLPDKYGYYWCRDPQIKSPFIVEYRPGQFLMKGYEWCEIKPPPL